MKLVRSKIPKFNPEDHMVELNEEQIAIAKEKLGTLTVPHGYDMNLTPDEVSEINHKRESKMRGNK